jgi:hypothetical protein
MKKILKQWGNTLVIRISPEEREIFGLDEDDIVDITIIKITKKEVVKHGKAKRNL